MAENEILESIRGRIIVSCQGTADTGNPFHTPEHMLLMARSAYKGGACGFRANTPPNILAIKEAYPQLPMIGIWKIVEGDNEVYITPHMSAVDTLVSLGCEIVALDGTDRKNARGQYAWQFLGEAKKKYPKQLIMADIATLKEAELCAKQGADIVSTTMCGYTEESKQFKGVCNFQLLKDIKEKVPEVFLICEGKIWSVEDAREAFESGADAIVIGTAITNPMSITQRFVDLAAKVK